MRLKRNELQALIIAAQSNGYCTSGANQDRHRYIYTHVLVSLRNRGLMCYSGDLGAGHGGHRQVVFKLTVEGALVVAFGYLFVNLAEWAQS